MTASASQIRVQDIENCGIVAGIIDQMCLVEQINQILDTHHQEIVSPGQAVKAMILNGLGLVSAPLDIFEKFFVGTATGCHVVYLPSYSPDLNRIEKCWAWLKSMIRKLLPKSDNLRDAIETVLKQAAS
ncbi:hypothetical protein ACX27_05235 [Nostoc piscinale CENA21]|uniref:DUF4277 domain-containing protein n=1 Tax=Nostoc piscinale CENA21 TaxID=224013 RepID=A0A0M5TIH2_9NOSO|nr:DUF4277 domain-containing protein [Nostoc piscinale]ALF52388.1 hypothetical protein ACX27_05235 [Nostoc piscinale CENA21]